MICKECKEKLRGTFAGQAFTDYTCKMCGRIGTWCNTNTPKYCPECSDSRLICARCGKDMAEETDFYDE